MQFILNNWGARSQRRDGITPSLGNALSHIRPLRPAALFPPPQKNPLHLLLHLLLFWRMMVGMDPSDASFWMDFLRGMLKPVAALAVVLMAVALSFTQKLKLEGEIVYAIARAFLQLSIIGFVLQFIFTQKNAVWIILAYLFMVPSRYPIGTNRSFWWSRSVTFLILCGRWF